jgi:hypothetical protein
MAVTSRFMLGIIVLLGLAACGGGGGSNNDVSANGFWFGTITESGSDTYDMRAIFYNSRIIAASQSAGTIYDGSYTVNGNKISGNITEYEIDGGPVATATFTGTVTEQSSLSASFSTSYDTSGSISLIFNTLYNRTSSLSLLEGNWNYTSGSYSLTLTVQNDGALFGQDSNGCVFSGTIGLLNTTHNLYDMNTSIASCDNIDGSYTGFSSLSDNITTNDTLEIIGSNSNYIFIYNFTRQ